jgi:class 3 adenylate cyclase/energy-coupling factor transporter ATP-binding protein EcfA2
MAESLFSEIDSPANIPTGTVTFLFTDIQGSTKLLEQLREQYADVLAEQRDVLRAVFAKWNGHEIGTQGDSFFVAFPRALDAVKCTVEAQRALAAHTWPQNVKVYVRMGLHTGEPIIARTGYVGIDVHLAARIGAAGHGGQILLSPTTRGLVYSDLPTGVTLRDLGPHKLKDIRHPQEIYQVDIEGLTTEFPPLKTLSTDEAPAPGNSPFKGLQFFDEADADLFFGREAMTAQLVDRIQSQRFLAIIGASGSGKSSIVRAGVVPMLKRQPNSNWHIHVVTPTAHPLEALAASLTHAAESMTATTTLIDDLARDQRSLHLFVRKSHPTARLLVVVDQFEELFTLCRNEAERKSFVDNLLYAEAADGTNATTIIIVLRADFYEHLAQYAALREAVAKQQEYLGPMSIAELREAIEEPAKRGGWEFSPGLVDLMLHDVGATTDHQPEPVALPLLSHALLETWRRRRGKVMTLKGYSESGGVRGAIARTAETVFYTELNVEQQQIARSIFLRLTELGEGTQDTRRRATLDELFPPASFASPTQVEDVVVKLADARLITTGEGTIEVAHEALIREWSTLREWLTQNREG